MTVHAFPRNGGTLSHGQPGIAIAGLTSVVWIPLHEAEDLADALVDLAEAMRLNAQDAAE